MKSILKKIFCIGLATALFINCNWWGGSAYASAEEKIDQYIVITKGADSTQSIVEQYDVVSESGESALVDLTVREASDLKKEENIVCVEKDFIIEEETESDWNMQKPEVENWNIKSINAENATAPKPIKVAILDSGIDYTEDIVVKERQNFIDDDPVTTPLYEDTCGHGTSVASIICGKGYTGTSEGICDNVELYSARVLDAQKQAPISRIVEAIYWAIEKEVDIINMSFGTLEDSESLRFAIDAATESGILVIASTGNHGNDKIDYPAAYENVLAVGAINPSGEISDFSSTNETIDLFAPGEAVTTQGNFGYPLTLSGTSLATAHVTGVAACLWGKDCDKSADFIRMLLKKSAKEIHDTEGKLVDYQHALDIYDEFENGYDELTSGVDLQITPEKEIIEEIEVQANNESMIDYSDSTVTGSWTKVVHQMYCQNSAMKIGAIYADKHNPMQGIYENPEFHGYAWHKNEGGALGTGDCNYMSNYRFLVKVANAYGNGGGYLTVDRTDIKGLSQDCYDQMVDGFKSIKAHDLDDSSSGAKNCDYCGNSVNIWNKGNDSLQKAFVMGLAMHTATDTFAHSAFRKKATSPTTWSRITHGSDNDADDVNVCPRRVQMAYNTEQKVVSRFEGNRGNYHTCNDFYDGSSGAYTGLGFRITKMKTFASNAGYTNEDVLAKFEILQSE